MQNKNPRGLFDEEIRLTILSVKKDPSMKLDDRVARLGKGKYFVLQKKSYINNAGR